MRVFHAHILTAGRAHFLQEEMNSPMFTGRRVRYNWDVRSTAVPEAFHSLFWDVDPADIMLPEHSDCVLERLMQRGGWDAMKWVRTEFENSVLVDFLVRKGHRLAPRERSYWGLVSGVNLAPATGGGRPSWACR